MILGLASVAALILQGCMLMHFMDDHHSGMMGHGKETHEGKNESEHQPAVLLDRNPRTDSQGGMIVEIQFRELSEKGEFAFTVKMNDPVIGINQYGLDSLATVHTLIYEQKKGVKLGDTFRGICTLMNPLDWSQNSTAILQAASRAEFPN